MFVRFVYSQFQLIENPQDIGQASTIVFEIKQSRLEIRKYLSFFKYEMFYISLKFMYKKTRHYK